MFILFVARKNLRYLDSASCWYAVGVAALLTMGSRSRSGYVAGDAGNPGLNQPAGREQQRRWRSHGLRRWRHRDRAGGDGSTEIRRRKPAAQVEQGASANANGATAIGGGGTAGQGFAGGTGGNGGSGAQASPAAPTPSGREARVRRLLRPAARRAAACAQASGVSAVAIGRCSALCQGRRGIGQRHWLGGAYNGSSGASALATGSVAVGTAARPLCGANSIAQALPAPTRSPPRQTPFHLLGGQTRTLVNVNAGAVNATSTDAVIGSQLYTVQQTA